MNIWHPFLLQSVFRYRPPVPEEKRFRDEFRKSITSLGANHAPSSDHWRRFTRRFCELVQTDDPRRFLCWDVIAETMFVGNAAYVAAELADLRRRKDWADRWQAALGETTVGSPRPYRRYRRSSGNLVHHAYHLAQFEAFCGRPVETLETVFEFGGGYGSMCRLFYNLGYRGRYVIFDFAPFSALQRYFLSAAGFPVLPQDTGKNRDQGIVCTSCLNALSGFLDSAAVKDRALVVATWSLSEAPVSLRDKILSMTAAFGHALIAFQAEFGGVDNRAYFSGLPTIFPRRKWQLREIESLAGNYYLFGRPGQGDLK